MKIGVIVSYCSYDWRTIDAVLEGLRPIASSIVVSASTHFFDGIPEESHHLQNLAQLHPDIQFIEYLYSEKTLYGLAPAVAPSDSDWAHYWHSVSRYVPLPLFDASFDWILFVDADEVIDPSGFKAFFATISEKDYQAIRFGSYFYFRSARYRALSGHSHGPLMIRRSQVRPEEVLDVGERRNLMEKIVGKKIHFASLGEDYFVHHYSWVRTFEELHRKVSCWGHRSEKDWKALLDQEFSAPFRGYDLLYGLTYEEVKPYFDPLTYTSCARKVPSRGPCRPILQMTPSIHQKMTLEQLLA